MSQLKTNSIATVAGTASTDVLNVINGSAKAWVNFNGTGTVAIRAAYNVSSITDNGTGDYTVNLTNAITDTNYAVVGILGQLAANTQPAVLSQATDTITTSACRFNTRSTTAKIDNAFNYVAVFR